METSISPGAAFERYRRARARRAGWESHWQECYDFALPQRDGFTRVASPGEKKTDRLFDGTAADSVDQLAASLLAQLTPPWSRWFGLAAGPEIPEAEADAAADVLNRAATVLQSHFDRSNFAVEIHQCYLDVVTGGTASLLFEEAPAGHRSAFRFTAVPLSQAVLDEGPDGRLDTTFRRSSLTVEQLRSRFPDATLPREIARRGQGGTEARLGVVEAVLPEAAGYRYYAFLDDETGAAGAPVVLAEGRFPASPFINFRWLKAPGEIYGRSPVMKALPDIKTANKVVELVLKNASIAVTGIWQADDDGVVNPATVKLVPGAIIPKAVGSAGLTPLEAPGRFDVSQLVLDDLRKRIRHALLTDKLGQVDSPRMTATEVLERSAEMARLLGATYGRLQSELLTPLVERGLDILRRRGEVPDLVIDGRTVDLEYRSPLARAEAHEEGQNTVAWLQSISTLGPEALSAVDVAATARWLGRAFGVPADLLRPVPAGPYAAERPAAALDGPAVPPAAGTDGTPTVDDAEVGDVLP